jgi:hypothetical protein
MQGKLGPGKACMAMRDIVIDVDASCHFHLQMVVKRAVKPSVDHRFTQGVQIQ